MGIALKDSYGRVLDYVRISVTDRCNYRCLYCMPEEGIEWIPHEEIMTY
ncbi:MAG: GTP 3',8-cyclase MoaA, partial [Synergistota bacterium]|nr:GTP 3',8-cyclase MoaA [Synergistota bacterium]